MECFLSNGLPNFDVVGLPDTAVKEARDRVRAAIKNCGMKFPVSRVTVNLAPADTRKAGTIYDLPILLGILVCTGELKPLPADAAFLGELSLAGALRPVRGALPMALAAKRRSTSRRRTPPRPPLPRDSRSIPSRISRSCWRTCAGKRRCPPRSPRRWTRMTAPPCRTSPTSRRRRTSSARWRSLPRAGTTS